MQIIFRTAPNYFWFFIIWCISKITQYILKQEKTVWEVIWERSLIYFDNDEYNLFINGIFLTTSIGGLWLLALYTFFDFTQKPKFIRKYKVNPNTHEPPDLKGMMKILILAAFNATFITKPTFILIFYVLKWREFPDIQVLPNIQTVLISCFISDHLYDAVVYCVHRTLHHRFFYKSIHKLHHEYKSPIAFAALYSHPVEQVFQNSLPLCAGLFVLRCHIATAWIYMISSMFSSTITHSGYHLPFLNSPQWHDYHHMKFDCNYSTIGLMDRIFGTDKMYRNSVCEKRDELLISFKSTRELYPDKN
ncbi:unnamed protein product [Chironomus riparius]|uniref:Fatty acid hydroxylase domain-containing protein n=1 Tax=Chironomus riparius TaxID=315576 RepID=A0A9N9S4N2_9DIPT|nr:unnamed protein product [Chironomus riparius]